jgi:hypothetical protein
MGFSRNLAGSTMKKTTKTKRRASAFVRLCRRRNLRHSGTLTARTYHMAYWPSTMTLPIVLGYTAVRRACGRSLSLALKKTCHPSLIGCPNSVPEEKKRRTTRERRG